MSIGLFLPNHLQWIQIPLHSAADCETIFPGYITDNMVCAGSPGHATCMVGGVWGVSHFQDINLVETDPCV